MKWDTRLWRSSDGRQFDRDSMGTGFSLLGEFQIKLCNEIPRQKPRYFTGLNGLQWAQPEAREERKPYLMEIMGRRYKSFDSIKKSILNPKKRANPFKQDPTRMLALHPGKTRCFLGLCLGMDVYDIGPWFGSGLQ